MNDAEVTKFDDYWRTIARNEDFIRLHGHNGCPDWEDKWHQDLEDAYTRIQPLLNSMTYRRMFNGLPGGLNPFDAENCHDALTKFLNPPERWFGNVGVLRSEEYLALKRAAEEEESAVAQSSPADGSAAANASPLEGLNDTAVDILQAIDERVPRRWHEIADRAGYSHDKVRQYSKSLQNAKLIKKTPRGFIRLVTLPEGCDIL